MTLYLEAGGMFTRWAGEPISGILHPRDIEQRWTADELEAIGLFAPAPAYPAPAGKQVVSTRVERLGGVGGVGGVVRFVNVLQDIPRPSSADIAAEVERRISLPLSVVGLSVGDIQVNMDAPSQRNLQGLASVGLYLVGAAPAKTTSFRDYANTSHDLLPSDLVSLGLQVAGRIQAVYAASWALKEMTSIPADYTDDAYWP